MFRITKNIHNILQGVSHPDQRISSEEKQAIIDWITENANRYWFSEDGPLRAPEEGGADVVIVSNFFLLCSHAPLQLPLTGHTGSYPPLCTSSCVSLTGATSRRVGGEEGREHLHASMTTHADDPRSTTRKCRASSR